MTGTIPVMAEPLPTLKGPKASRAFTPVTAEQAETLKALGWTEVDVAALEDLVKAESAHPAPEGPVGPRQATPEEVAAFDALPQRDRRALEALSIDDRAALAAFNSATEA